MTALSYDEWFEEYEDKLYDAAYIAYMETGAYHDTDQGPFEESFFEQRYEEYVSNIDDAMIDAHLIRTAS